MYNVLIVDDEPTVLLGLNTLIDWNRNGFETADTASNGVEALHMYRNKRYDVIITDIKMPEMDGISLIREIAALDPTCRIIILSAYGEFAYAQEAMKYGVRYYLLKPIEETILEGYLSKICEDLDSDSNQIHQDSDFDRIEDQYRMSVYGVVNEIRSFLNSNYAKSISLNYMADKYGFSAAYLGRVFKRDTGKTFNEYLSEVRIRCACSLLKNTEKSINDIVFETGFNDVVYFYKLFKKVTGKTPNQFRSLSDN